MLSYVVVQPPHNVRAKLVEQNKEKWKRDEYFDFGHNIHLFCSFKGMVKIPRKPTS